MPQLSLQPAGQHTRARTARTALIRAQALIWAQVLQPTRARTARTALIRAQALTRAQVRAHTALIRAQALIRTQVRAWLMQRRSQQLALQPAGQAAVETALGANPSPSRSRRTATRI